VKVDAGEKRRLSSVSQANNNISQLTMNGASNGSCDANVDNVKTSRGTATIALTTQSSSAVASLEAISAQSAVSTSKQQKVTPGY
jgi:hypothetical protein